jgi:hypothetical protein
MSLTTVESSATKEIAFPFMLWFSLLLVGEQQKIKKRTGINSRDFIIQLKLKC